MLVRATVVPSLVDPLLVLAVRFLLPSFDDRLADDETALAQLRVLYSDRARSSNQ